MYQSNGAVQVKESWLRYSPGDMGSDGMSWVM